MIEGFARLAAGAEQLDAATRSLACALVAAMHDVVTGALARIAELAGRGDKAPDPEVAREAFSKIEQLIGEAERLDEPAAVRALAAESIGVVGEVLVRGMADAGDELAERIADDELIGNLLVLAGVHPHAAHVRARRALERATAELISVGVRFEELAELDGVNAAIVHVKLAVAGHERPAAVASIDDARVRGLVEAIVMTRAPDVAGVRVEIAGRIAATPDFVPRDRLRRRDAEPTHDAHDRCDLCALPLAAQHDHLYAPATRELRCACLGCALIIPSSEGSAYRRVPRGAVRLAIADVTGWLDRLGVPVGLAALIRRDDGRAILAYPGPAGLVEAEVDAATWAAMCERVPAAGALEPDVEALLLSRLGGESVTRAGIDVVFRIVGELRRSWQGITGGAEGPAAIARVLAELHAEAA